MWVRLAQIEGGTRPLPTAILALDKVTYEWQELNQADSDLNEVASSAMVIGPQGNS
jgi:hypothetical protein